MRRRTFLQASLLAALGAQLQAAVKSERLEAASRVLQEATQKGQVKAAALHVRNKQQSFDASFGLGVDQHARFLLGSISKPIAMTALMKLFDQGKFRLEDRLQKFLPDFKGDGRDQVLLRHVLSHVSGLPDQLAENDQLRKSHAPLSAFVAGALKTPLQFVPGSRYQYSSMGILLAARVAEVITQQDIVSLVNRTVLQPLGMRDSVQGLGKLALKDFVPMQTEFAAPEAGGGDPTAKEWDWNSPYWRQLGAPWGGTHASAGDVGKFLAEFLYEQEAVVKRETARLMTRNHNAEGQTPRGLGFNVGIGAGSKGCSVRTFGHTGSTGTIAWADPESDTICVVLTSLPARAVQPHPRDVAAGQVADGN